jgi:hypothetical protein
LYASNHQEAVQIAVEISGLIMELPTDNVLLTASLTCQIVSQSGECVNASVK